jgi:hypothetical protein
MRLLEKARQRKLAGQVGLDSPPVVFINRDVSKS